MITEDQEYEQLIRPIEGQMMRSVWRVTQNPEDAEDAFQEALGVIWRRLGRVRKHANPHALILRICLNAAYDVLRKKHRRQRREQVLDHGHADTPPTPADTLAARERESAVLRAISQLSRNQALAVTLRLVQGEPYGTIARTLGCKANTARKHVERGRTRLRELLAPHLEEEAVQ